MFFSFGETTSASEGKLSWGTRGFLATNGQLECLPWLANHTGRFMQADMS